MIDWKLIVEIASFMSSIAVVLGVPIGLYQYYRVTNKEHREHEFSAYDESDSAYLDYLKLCFENPKLDIFDIPDKKPSSLSDEEKKQELIAFTILIAVFERAHFVYQTAPSTVVERQWKGWDEYVRDYCKRDKFKIAWMTCGDQFDDSFQNYMQDIIDNTPSNNRLQSDAIAIK